MPSSAAAYYGWPPDSHSPSGWTGPVAPIGPIDPPPAGAITLGQGNYLTIGPNRDWIFIQGPSGTGIHLDREAAIRMLKALNEGFVLDLLSEAGEKHDEP